MNTAKRSILTVAALGAVALIVASCRKAPPQASTGPAPATAPRAADGKVTAIRDVAEFRARVLEAKRPVLVKFYTQWCPYCAQLTPVLAGLAGQYAGRVDFVEIDAEALPPLAQQYHVEGVPAVRIFRNGRVVHSIPGYNPPPLYRTALDPILGNGK
jgi:thioredoxin-like negative regulator of GroEL